MTVHRSNPAALHGAPGFITQIVQATGPLAFISGQVSQRVDGTWAGIGNHREQAEQIARNIDVTLNELGLSRDAIVKETVYVVDYAPALLLDVVGPLRDGRSEPPASTLIGVPALFAPEAPMEVELVVALEP